MTLYLHTHSYPTSIIKYVTIFFMQIKVISEGSIFIKFRHKESHPWEENTPNNIHYKNSISKISIGMRILQLSPHYSILLPQMLNLPRNLLWLHLAFHIVFTVFDADVGRANPELAGVRQQSHMTRVIGNCHLHNASSGLIPFWVLVRRGGKIHNNLILSINSNCLWKKKNCQLVNHLLCFKSIFYT